MKVITKSSFFQFNNAYKLKKHITLAVLGIILSSCSIGSAVTSRIGFTMKNPFYSDANAANSKYNWNFFDKSKRVPEGNLLYTTMQDEKVINKYDVIRRDSQKYNNAKIDHFWKKVYGRKSDSDWSLQNKIQPVTETNLNEFGKKDITIRPNKEANSKKPGFISSLFKSEPKNDVMPVTKSNLDNIPASQASNETYEIEIDDTEEKVLNEISFKEEAAPKASLSLDAKMEKAHEASKQPEGKMTITNSKKKQYKHSN